MSATSTVTIAIKQKRPRTKTLGTATIPGGKVEGEPWEGPKKEWEERSFGSPEAKRGGCLGKERSPS